MVKQLFETQDIFLAAVLCYLYGKESLARVG